MNYLSPSILGADFTRLGEEINTVVKAGAQWVHLDVMDGNFVPNLSMGPHIVNCIRKSTDATLDTHLMILHPEKYVEKFAQAGADLITIHLEACTEADPREVLQSIRELGCRAGIAINPETPVDKVLSYVKDCDMVLVMSVHPGFGGQSFIEETYDKIRQVKTYIDENQLICHIEVDGGVNLDNLPKLLETGANVIVAGSSVYKGDATINTQQFLEIMGE